MKFVLPGCFVRYPSYPTNRASGNELFIAELRDNASADAAVGKLREEVQKWYQVERNFWNPIRTTMPTAEEADLRIGARGKFVVMHSFYEDDTPIGDRLVRMALQP